MRYSIPETKSLLEKWRDSESVIKIVFSDVAVGGSVFALVKTVSSEPAELLAECEVLLPNGAHGATGLLGVNFWGNEDIEFTDFTDSPLDMIPADSLDRYNCCLAIQYEHRAMVSICEVWSSPELDILRGMKVSAQDIQAMLEFVNEAKNRT
jgi:hypothetical protein